VTMGGNYPDGVSRHSVPMQWAHEVVVMVRCSGNDIKAVWWSQKYYLSKFHVWKRFVEGSFPWVESYPDGVSEHSVPSYSGYTKFVPVVRCSGND